jgi:NTP pyrophosphatase (non-canonical NTP hydrolase)
MSMNVTDQVLAEVRRATEKFPTWPTDPLHALAVLGEEFGELTKAMLQHTYEPHKGVTQQDIRDEAIQTAAMAMRLAMSLPCYAYRKAPQHSQGSVNLPDDYEV